MGIVRTSDERFENIDGLFVPHYLEVDELRVHYADEGPRDGETVLMLHGEPSWSYLYRKMIPIFTAAGYRAVAPDLPGFGRSDKPARREDYTYQRHVDWMRGFIEALDLTNITLVCQDWGGLIGLRLAAEQGERFSRIVAANTFLPTGDFNPGPAFMKWRDFALNAPSFDIGTVIQKGTVTDLSPEVLAADNAPFPDERYKEGARSFPALVPVSPDDPAAEPNRRAWKELEKWEKPFLTAFGDSDPITRGGDLYFQAKVPGCGGQEHVTIEGAGHFIQEDRGVELADVVVRFMKKNP
ncbi:MAG TPA: alpha/beta fold hydrolase [Spirochaetes bacterium]|nr:alpha/beta fold hydrolase [Spirochaetota bacterium]